jgi:hypothetical protein
MTRVEHALAAFGLIAVSAGIAFGLLQPGVLDYLDAPVHLCWMQGFHDALSDGVLLPRWSASDHHGLGAPVFVHYAPLAYYLGAFAMALGGGPDVALRVVFAFSAIGSAAAVFAWLRTVVDTRLALGLALCAALMPALLYVGWRVNSPGAALASVGVACTLFALESLWRERRHALVLLAIAFAVVVLTHLLNGLMLGAVLGVILLAALARAATRAFARRLFAALLIGSLLSSAYWLPAVWESGAIQAQAFTQSKRAGIDELLLFGSSAVLDRWPERAFIELASLLLAGWLLLSAWRVWRAEDSADRRIATACIALAMLVFVLMTPLARPLYVTVDALAALQFGWRWLPLFALLVLRAAAFTDPSSSRRAALGTGFVTACIALALAWQGTALLDVVRHPLLPAQARLDSAQAASEATMCRFTPPEYRPRSLTSELEWSELRDSAWRMRVQSGSARLLSEVAGTHERALTIEADLPSRVELRLFALPGWVAHVDGRQVPIAGDSALVTVDVPTGLHVLEVAQVGTRVRDVAWLLSLIGVLLIAIACRAERARLKRAMLRHP